MLPTYQDRHPSPAAEDDRPVDPEEPLVLWTTVLILVVAVVLVGAVLVINA